MSTWTQPICMRCYSKREPDRTPVQLVRPFQEQCCDCGEPTYAGIYIRLNPKTVRFPSDKTL